MSKYEKRKRKSKSHSKGKIHRYWLCLAFGAAVTGAAISLIIRSIIRNEKLHESSIMTFVEQFDVCGIDVSHYQAQIDWPRLARARIGNKPIQFVLLKATEGTSLLDKCFKLNFANANQSNMVNGAYHFYIPGSSSAQQARFYIKTVNLSHNSLPPILDVEQRGKETAEVFQNGVLEWLNLVEKHYGMKPIIYASASFRKKHLTAKEFDDYPFWVAHYNVQQPKYNGAWTFWQFSESGQVEGINGPVDLNVFNGSRADLLRMTVGAKETITNKQP